MAGSDARPPRPPRHRAKGSRGGLVASVLAGSWRQSPPPPSISPAELAEVAPVLLSTGSASLGWWRIRHSELCATSAACELQQAYRLHTLQAARHELHMVGAVKLLQSVGVDPLLAKGWAAARCYAERGLRPYGDIDLWVRPEQYATAEAALRNREAEDYQVDLHQGTWMLQRLDRSWEQLYDRSRIERVGDVEIRTVGSEDHLRMLCLLMLYQGAWRPLWLCDIGAFVENLPEGFDWESCLSGNQRRSDWVACAIGLAHQLLGARLNGAPVASRATHLPKWLVPSLLRQWSSGEHYMHSPTVAYCLRHPAELPRALRLRWPNPIHATVGVGGPFNELPRLPFQLGECFMRTAHFMRRAKG